MFVVDLPKVREAFEFLDSFDSKTKAVEWIRENIGHCDDNGNICLITETQDEDSPEDTNA